MTPLLVVMLLSSTPEVHRVPPNRFDKTEMPSEAVYRQMHVCFNQSGGFREELVPVCGCMIDALRWNIKQGKPPATTPEQAKECNKPTEPTKKKGIDL